MPFLMPNTWKRNKLVVHTVPYDLTILEDGSVFERAEFFDLSTDAGNRRGEPFLRNYRNCGSSAKRQTE
jgi:hypothetical protein